MEVEGASRAVGLIRKWSWLSHGSWPGPRKSVLDAIREELRKRDYLPILLDFELPGRNITETLSLLAHMVRFIVADLTDAKSIMVELRVIVPDLPSVPVQPIILASQEEPGMFDFFRHFPWVLDTYRYAHLAQLLADLDGRVIAPAEAKVREWQTLLEKEEASYHSSTYRDNYGANSA